MSTKTSKDKFEEYLVTKYISTRLFTHYKSKITSLRINEMDATLTMCLKLTLLVEEMGFMCLLILCTKNTHHF